MAEKFVTLAEVKEMLEDAKKERELNYDQSRALEHCLKFSKLDAKKAKKLVEDLVKLEIEERIAVKIADICPKTEDEVTAIFAKEHAQFKEPNRILEIVSKHI